MGQRTIPHQLGLAAARERIAQQAAIYSRTYRLASGWRSSSVWVGKRLGITVEIRVGEGSVEVWLEKHFLVPVTEERILSGIESGLRAALGSP